MTREYWNAMWKCSEGIRHFKSPRGSHLAVIEGIDGGPAPTDQPGDRFFVRGTVVDGEVNVGLDCTVDVEDFFGLVNTYGMFEASK